MSQTVINDDRVAREKPALRQHDLSGVGRANRRPLLALEIDARMRASRLPVEDAPSAEVAREMVAHGHEKRISPVASGDALKDRRQALRLLPNPFDRALGGTPVAWRHVQPPGRKSFGCDLEIVGHGKLRVPLTNRPDDHAVPCQARSPHRRQQGPATSCRQRRDQRQLLSPVRTPPPDPGTRGRRRSPTRPTPAALTAPPTRSSGRPVSLTCS